MFFRLPVLGLVGLLLCGTVTARAQEVPDPPRVSAAPTFWRRPVFWAGLVSVGVVAGCAANSFLDNPQGEFRVEDEGWFGEDTYAGGADKASHFVSFELLARELGDLYRLMGIAPAPSYALGAGVSLLSGLIVELGDGTNQYGFSWGDLAMDGAGVASAWLLSTFELHDLFGFRFGLVPGPVPPKATSGKGRDYSHEIYTGDLKLAGVIDRLGFHDGPFDPLRYLLVSVTYGTKGYPDAAKDDRERQVGVEIGINFGAILDALAVRRGTWLGFASHIAADDFRIPYTAGGFRWDANHDEWRGPDTGNSCGGC